MVRLIKGYKMNRRDILKTAILAPLVGLMTGRAAGIDTAKEIKWTVIDVTPGPNRAVWYGKAQYDYPVGWIGLNMSNKRYDNMPITRIHWADVIVNCLESIKKGQIIVWYPDGTIRGAKIRRELTQWGPQHNL